MKWYATMLTVGLAVATFTVLTGCAKPDEEAGPQEVSENPPPPPPGSEHPTEGPHHGSLIELGKEEYHAELVHDEKAKTVTIYLLDGPTAKESVAADAKEVAINVKHDGKPEQFKLMAQPDERDPERKSSRFVSNDAELIEHLDEEGSEAMLAVKIDGKSFNGKISHDHEGHSH